MKAGTGRSRTDRHRIPYIPTIYRIFGGKTKTGKSYGKTDGSGSEIRRGILLIDSTDPVLIQEIPVGNPIYVFFSQTQQAKLLNILVRPIN